MEDRLIKDCETEGFKILEAAPIDELNAAGIYARHIKTGAEVFHIHNDDAENTFAFIFKTSPEDSSGVFHIIEHSVLCGSRKFPLKDAFIVLEQGSLQTYLNAWTFYDKTVYPASSINESDYFNLMNVYGDAVLHPNLAEWTFLQEGRRFEFKKDASGAVDKKHLQINGVVYNEMKGAYSAIDEYAAQWSVKSVLPDTLYAFDSGGDPACIPDLTYENFLRFYKKYYSPANMKIFLCGNIPTQKQLKFLNENFLAAFGEGDCGFPAPCAPSVPRWDSMRRYTVKSPASASGEGGNKASAFVSWLCGEFDFSRGGKTKPARDALTMNLLCEILLGNDSAPLAKALVESGLGEDLANTSGFEDEIKFNILTAGLRGLKSAKNAPDVEKLIFKELRRLAKNGIEKRDVEAALFSVEFNVREVRRSGGGPWALALLRRCMRGWLNGGKPWDALCVKEDFNAIKAELAGGARYFEGLIQKKLLDGPRCALVTIIPDPSFNEEAARKYEAYISKKEAELDGAKTAEIEEKCAALERIQNEPDSKESLALIPHLSLKDLDGSLEKTPFVFESIEGAPVMSSPVPANGVSYLSAAMPVDVLPFSDYIYLPFFTRCVCSVGSRGKDWALVSNECARNLGGFSAFLYSPPSSAVYFSSRDRETPCGIIEAGGRDWIIFSFKTLDEKVEDASALVSDIIRHADFSDLKRLRTLVLEARNSFISAFSFAGSFLTLIRAGALFDRSAVLGELWNGITQFKFINELPDMDISKIAEKLTSIRDALVNKSGVLLNITGCCKEAFSAAGKYFAPFGNLGYPLEETALAYRGEKLEPKIEVFSSPSLQVGFAGMCIRSSNISTKECAAETVLSHHLSTGALWENLRMKCGAYGASCSVDALRGEARFATYRDPSPASSAVILPEILDSMARKAFSAEECEKTIIGVYSRFKRPSTAIEKGMRNFFAFLNGSSDDLRQKRLDNALGVKAVDLEAAALRFARSLGGEKGVCVLTGVEDARRAAETFGVEVQELPV
ncbi:MAG: insulinase family protein [Spirochaetaceae bacterium]|jgi:Zn-dependent M16 (insulinase) family peptidase|nr:insulinase family protein [Spirochaetaceae bacterium]